jgi:tRNA-dihydrouridine synthase C
LLGRGIVADPGLAIAIASGGGRQLDWPAVLDLLADFWLLVGRHFEPGYRAGRLKQWLQFLRQRHPEAAEAYLRLRTVTDSRGIACGLFGVERAQALEQALGLPSELRR